MSIIMFPREYIWMVDLKLDPRQGLVTRTRENIEASNTMLERNNSARRSRYKIDARA